MVFADAKKVVKPDTIMYSAIMGAVANEKEAVLELHAEMQESGLEDDDVTTWQIKQARGNGSGNMPSPRYSSGGEGSGSSGGSVSERLMPSSGYQPMWRKGKKAGNDDLDGDDDNFL